MNDRTTAELPILEVSKLPRCQHCSEEGNLQTADEGPKTNICGFDNHPEYRDIPMVQLKLVTAE